MAVLSYNLCLLLFLTSLTNPTACLGLLRQNNNHVALFIFGDSLYDPGNNNYINTTTDFQANFWPYGETFFNYPTGRFGDGRLIPDFIAEYAKLPLIPAYLQPGNHQFVYGANFASGGAGALIETYQGLVVSLKTQLSYFKNVEKQLRQKLGDKEAKQLLSNSVYLISIGGNDYLSRFVSNSSAFPSYTPKEIVEIVIGNFTAAIQEIYDKGGRKFGFLTLPPLGCWPSIRVLEPYGNCNESATSLIKLHNKALSQNLKKLEKQLKGFMHMYFDFYTSFSNRMNNPSKYGFKNGNSACCGSGPYGGVYSCGGKRGVKDYKLCHNTSEFLFFDSNHATETATQQLAKLMWHGNPNVTGPYNLKSLFEGTQLLKV